MKILIDIGHPAHVHYYKYLYHELKNKHNIIITTKNVPIIKELLNHYDMPFINIGSKGSNLAKKYIKQVHFTIALVKIIREYKIDMTIGVTPAIVHSAFLTQKKSILFNDDDQAVLSRVSPITTPLASVLMSPDCLKYEKRYNAIYYPGYHELAYLYPKQFNSNPGVLEKNGLSIDDKYYILRFNAFKAHHDIKEGGMNLNQKRQLIKLLEQYGKVFITTEKEIDPEFERYRIPIKPYEMHNFLAFSQMLVSDSQTMSSEAAVLGIPSFRCNTFAGRLSILEEEEKRYGLTYGYLPRQFDWMLEAIERVLKDTDAKAKWEIKRNRMLEDKIDVTAFWIWFIDNYPESLNEVKRKDFNFSRFK